MIKGAKQEVSCGVMMDLFSSFFSILFYGNPVPFKVDLFFRLPDSSVIDSAVCRMVLRLAMLVSTQETITFSSPSSLQYGRQS